MIAYSYDDANRMTATTLPSGTGIVSSFSYDNADRLTGISHVKNGSTTIASVAYTLDDVGNRTQRVDQQGTHTYAYDDLYRLTSVTYPGPATTSYTFDAFGNRTSMTDASGTTDYTYDDADRLTEVDPPSASAVAYTWDDNGNLTDRDSDEFEWDEADRMVSATVNSVTTTFAYRGDGLRESRTVGMSTTTFTWDVNAGLPVVLYDGSYYLYGFGLEAMEQSGDWYSFLADGQGSTMAIVDDAGAVQNSYTYDVYGEPTVTGSLANEFDFAGQQTDGDTGLQYLRARYMDPETGVFLSREPLAAMLSWMGNHFGYAFANPMSKVDPTGLFPVEGESGTSDCQHGPGLCETYGPGYDYGYPDEVREWPGEPYRDISVTIGVGLVLVVGCQVSDIDIWDVHCYIAGGGGTPGIAITSGDAGIADGGFCAASGSLSGVTTQVGVAGGSVDEYPPAPFTEGGFTLPPGPGVSFICGTVWDVGETIEGILP